MILLTKKSSLHFFLIQKRNKFKSLLVNIINKSIVLVNKYLGVNKIVNTFKFYKKSLNIITHILIDFKPDTIILSEDVVGAVTPLIVKVSKNLKIPVIIIPYTICDELEAFETLEKILQYNCKIFMNNFLSLIYPEMV